MLSPKIDGRTLHFRLSGINNQNFLMQDEETGSWWQQISGKAITGPMKGKRLAQVFHDELSFALWKRENAGKGRVLRPDRQVLTNGRYAKSDWEKRLARLPVPLPFQKKNIFEPREIVIGVIAGTIAKAYSLSDVLQNQILIDRIGDTSLVLVVGDDQRSIRGFNTSINGQAVEFFRVPESVPMRMQDSISGSEWDFTGKAINGPLTGARLHKIAITKDYWFDWKNYHPDTLVFGR